MKKYLVGVDGGGSKTLVVIADLSGNVVGMIKGDSSNQNNHTVDYVFRLIQNLIFSILPSDCDCFDVSLGIAGLIASGKKEELFERLKTMNKVGEIFLNSDINVALDSSYIHQDGAIGIIGTGFVIFYKYQNQYYQIAGKGYLKDNGLSGYDIGKRVYQHLFDDNKPSFYWDVIQDFISLKEIEKGYLENGEVYLSKFCKYAFIYQDELSISIIRECVNHFENYLNQIHGVNEITLFGGLSKIWDKFTPYLSKQIKDRFHISFIHYESVVGEFVYFKEYDEAFKSNLLRCNELNIKN